MNWKRLIWPKTFAACWNECVDTVNDLNRTYGIMHPEYVRRRDEAWDRYREQVDHIPQHIYVIAGLSILCSFSVFVPIWAGIAAFAIAGFFWSNLFFRILFSSGERKFDEHRLYPEEEKR